MCQLLHSPPVLVNPSVRVLGSEQATHREGCLSIAGYSAHVTRPLSVLVRRQVACAPAAYVPRCVCGSPQRSRRRARRGRRGVGGAGTVTDGPRPGLRHSQVKGLDEHGKAFEWKADGWPARIAQHEVRSTASTGPPRAADINRETPSLPTMHALTPWRPDRTPARAAVR